LNVKLESSQGVQTFSTEYVYFCNVTLMCNIENRYRRN